MQDAIAPSPAAVSSSPQHDFPGLLNQNQVLSLIGISRSSLYKRMQAGGFPAPVDIGINKNLWKASAVQEWIESLSKRSVH